MSDWDMTWSGKGHMADSVGIGDMTVGYSGRGMKQFSEELKQLYVNDVCNELDSLQKDIFIELSKCWTGDSKDKYVERLRDGIKKIETELNSEWVDLGKRLAEIGEFYVNEDKKLAE